jgi:pimeloyl-ACP methyl ester carboxylesterase
MASDNVEASDLDHIGEAEKELRSLPGCEVQSRQNTWMQPVTLNGCFGWLHGPVSPAEIDVVFLLCPGLGRDARTAHRSLRLLADQLAGEGYPALRLEYLGAGDSLDIDEQEQWAAWQQAIHLGADWLRSYTGARLLVLCGLRLGATLATIVAAQRKDVAGLLLLAPVMHGSLFIRQIMTEKADLSKISFPHAIKIAVFAEYRGPRLLECIESWRSSGSEVTCEEFTSCQTMLRDNHLNEEKQPDFSRLLTWARDHSSVLGNSRQRLLPIPLASILNPPGCIEVPVRFGLNNNLFGILCRPQEIMESDLVVVIGNTGGEPHYGFARFAVQLGRALALSGIASLRFDFSGLGDSVLLNESGETSPHIFDFDRLDDFNAAIELLKQHGFRRFALHGLCSGAYHAFHAGLRNSAVTALMLINMPTFTCRPAESIHSMSRRTTGTIGYYLKGLLRKRSWTNFVHGKLDLIGIFSSFCARLSDQYSARLRKIANALGGVDKLSFANRCLVLMAQRGVRTLFVFAAGDPGVENVERELGSTASSMAEIDGVSVLFDEGINHELSSRAARKRAISFTLHFLLPLV